MAYPTTTYTETPASVSTTYTQDHTGVSSSYTATPASASTAYAQDHTSPAASGHCDWTQSVDGGQRWIIEDVKDSICRLCYAVNTYCAGPTWIQTP